MNLAVIGIVILLVIGVILFFVLQGDDAQVEGPTGDVVGPSDENPQQVAGEEDGEGEAEKEEQETTKEDVPEDAPKVDDPSKVPGCVGLFTGESWNADVNQWKDLSGKDNHVTEVKGALDVTSDDSSNNQKYVFGGPSAGFKFPSACMSTGRKYTLFTVARYGGSTRDRIFDGTNNNFFSGFRKGHVGTAYRDGSGYIAHWMCAQDADAFCVHTDQKHLLRYNGLTRSGLTNNSAMIPSQLTVNYGQFENEGSDFDIAEVIFYDRELDSSEYARIENYLMRKYRILKSVRAQMHMLNLHREGRGMRGMNYMGASCGDGGVMNFHRLLQHKHKGQPVQKRHFDNVCVQGLEGGVDSKRTRYTELSKPWKEGYSDIMNIDCGGKGIAGYMFQESNDGSKIRTEYKCHNAPINKASCVKKSVDVTGENGTFNEDLNNVIANCDSGRAMTKLQFVQKDGKYKFDYECCNLEDQ